MARDCVALLAALAFLALAFPVRAQEARPSVILSADGTRLLAADGTPLVLRGVNWGWWGCVEPGDAAQLQAWGGNLVRIAFSYSKIVRPGTDDLGGEGLALLDSMVDWAETAGLWFVLDCHETPGGQSAAPYCMAGRNELWRESTAQDACVRMWDSLARRYRDRRWLLAYEVMNEPTPPPDYPMESYRALLLRLVDALRAVDPQRLIVVGGWQWGSLEGLTDDLVLPRPGLIYTFHFYAPARVAQEGASYPGRVTLEVTWLGNSPEAWGARGDTDWTLLERTFRAPAGATHGRIMLRSDRNAGSAWFDEVSLACGGVSVAACGNPDFAPGVRERGWKTERQTAGEFAWDAAEGHAAPGCLRVTGTDSYNAWTTTSDFAAQADAEYALQCWVKTRAASGDSYPSVAWFRHHDQDVDRAWIEERIRQAAAFSARHRVPVWCGEFGCSQSNPDGSGQRWVRDVGETLSRLGIPWTYWNWRETLGRGSMAVWVQEGGRYVMQEPLAEVLQGLLRPAR